MKHVIFFLNLFLFLSCSGERSLLSTGEDSSQQNGKISIEPTIYLSKAEQSIPLQQLNRENITLNLSDKIIFSDKKEKKFKSPYKTLEKAGQNEELKVKVSSFCSYEKNQTGGKEPHRSVQETGGNFYRWSFAIFELIPKEILLKGMDKIFYCSFIFAFKDSEDTFNYYNIVQQPITPYFNSEKTNQLSLIRETKSGSYLPVGKEIIESKNIPKILILNNTLSPVKSYQLFCEGLKIASFHSDFNGNNIFAKLMAYDGHNLPEGIKKCRIFSEQDGAFIGMTDSFLLDFNSLKQNRSTIDLSSIADSVIAVKDLNKTYKSGDKLPLNSYFEFNNLNISNKNNAIEITIHTQCIEPQKKNQMLSETYSFPFRKKIPIMAVTPKQMFFMEMSNSTYTNWLKAISRYSIEYPKALLGEIFQEKQSHSSNCIYKISLQDRHKPENKKDFETQSYAVQWTEKAYGIDEIIFEIYLEHLQIPTLLRPAYSIDINSRFEKTREEIKVLSPHRRDIIKKPFFSLKTDIYTNRINYLNLNFFDVIDDPFFQVEGTRLDKISLFCFSQNSQKKKSSIVLEWPYSLQMYSLSLKTFFLNPKIKEYIETAKISNCRLFLYEKDILRYFSEEMRISY